MRRFYEENHEGEPRMRGDDPTGQRDGEERHQ